MNEAHKECGQKNEEGFEEVLDLVKAEFANDNTLEFILKSVEDKIYLRINFQVERGSPYAEQSRVVEVNIKLDRIFMENGIFVDDMLSGPHYREYRLTKKPQY